MKVLNLRCGMLHAFEGWFGSEDDFQAQLAHGLVECPLCGDTHVQKMPSAPRLNLGNGLMPTASAPGEQAAAHAPQALAPSANANGAAPPAHMPSAEVPSVEQVVGRLAPEQQAAFFQAVREVIKKTEDVGERFAEEARRIHYGEAEARGIRGQASARETVELLEEGIDVLPLPLLPALKETLQ